MRAPKVTVRRQRYDNAKRVYHFIIGYMAEHSFVPSLDDISKGCFMASSTITRYLDLLEAWGCISRELGVARSIAITGAFPPFEKPEAKTADGDEEA